VTLVFRSPVLVREATLEDVEALVEVWGGELSRLPERDEGERCAQEAAASIARLSADPDQRIVVASIDDRVAGAVHLFRGPLSPVHTESAVYVAHLHVIDRFRRHGVGQALLEAAVTWAEEKDTTHVVAAASVNSRDANRFMARLGLTQIAVIRGSSTAALRAKLPVETPVAARPTTPRSQRTVRQVLVRRRSLRRAQSRPS
jgi:GNAT superfamily N-acetyltransferase